MGHPYGFPSSRGSESQSQTAGPVESKTTEIEPIDKKILMIPFLKLSLPDEQIRLTVRLPRSIS